MRALLRLAPGRIILGDSILLMKFEHAFASERLRWRGAVRGGVLS